MTLLDFARGPALQWSIAIMILGIAWRLAGVFLSLRQADLSEPRSKAVVRGGLRAILTRSAPARELEKNIRFQHYTGYAWHIGFFITVLFFAPHVEFFESILGFGWPSMPSNIAVITGAITLAILVTLLIRRMLHPVMRLITTLDDYISLFVMIVPLITGLMAYAHVGLRYETMLGVHILSVEAMFVWIPFGKLMHMFFWIPSRFRIGAFFERKGIKA